MTYLELCKRTRLECGLSGDGPSTVIGQAGQLQKVITFVAQAWTDLQSERPNWLFMWSEFEFDTDAGVRDYLAADKSITDMDNWDENSFLIYDPSIGESDQGELPYLPYKNWREQYRRQMNVRENNRPILFTILPNEKVRFEPAPDKAYTIEGEYKRTTQTFANNADTPTGLPDRFHIVIVYRALQLYALQDDAPELVQKAEEQLDTWMPLLELDQLPAMKIGSDPIGGLGPNGRTSGNFSFY